MKPIQVGLLGIGTVGSGTFNVLQRNQEEIRRRAGRGIEIAMVADLDTERARSVVGDTAKVVGDAREIDRKSTRLNSSHLVISYAVFCLKKKKRVDRHVDVVEQHSDDSDTCRV